MISRRWSREVLSAFVCATVLASVGCAAEDGANGVDGASGANGIDGVNGKDGKNGTNGTNGKDGLDGTDGTNGKDGKDGLDGANGTDGTNGKDGKDGLDGTDGTNGTNGASSLIRTASELAGEHCANGGIAVQVGPDTNANGTLDDGEVDAKSTKYLCNTLPAWPELPALPAVTTAYSFALAVNDVDQTARLGFMFNDATYRAQLASEGPIWDGGGVYTGANVFAVYGFAGTGVNASWKAYQGRYTPQFYAYSELAFDSGSSYYTTNYTSFGGLIAVVKDGGKGTYALTPAFSPGKAHSIAFVDHVLYALMAQKNVGMTLSTFPVDQFGNLSNVWKNLATVEAAASAATAPKLINAGGTLVGAYLVAGKATIRATTTPATMTQGTEFVEIGSCAGATRVDLGFAGGKLYAGCIDTNGLLSVRRAALTDLANVAWETLTLGVTGATSELDLSGLGTRMSLAVRQGTAVRAYASITDTTPSFDAVLPGSFDLVSAKEGLVLSVCDLTGTKTVRTFLH